MRFSGDARFPPGSAAFVHKRIIGGIIGGIGGGLPGAIAGFAGGGGSKRMRPAAVLPIDISRPHVHPPTAGRAALVHGPHGPGATAFGANGPCLPGEISFRGSCVDPSAILPFGDPLIRPAAGTVLEAGGGAVMGGFGIPAMVPTVVQRVVRECDPGLVLGRDNLCYPKAVLQRRSRFRKWRQPTRPVMTGADKRTIRRADSLRDEVKELNKMVGLRVPTKRVAKKK